jgi:hypothetical protein
LTALAAVGVFALPTPAAANHVYALQWGSPGSGSGQLNDAAGIDTDRFDNGRKLKPGLYRATALAGSAGGKSGPAAAKFKVSH